MNIIVSNEAANWYQNEIGLKEGDFVRFFVRYGGCSTVQKGFSLGVEKEAPIGLGAQTVVDGITYYIEEKDLWYFDGHDLEVNFNNKFEEPEFNYQK
ncbi:MULTISPECIES: HesB/YadR/YfhF family protein [unclassified Bacillus (in: firmicutes)]|uniref:HesB/YadR/YfhF family protein n=1 Tax=unclassified Bacillus (in: firmicutes) TaxID=185979 RepID=UPI0008E1CB82|nr:MULTISPECIES: HesB/YadR/YfhF family protein [unclassified Bacillus (in: firmicutes)]SFA89117.1 Uncharacterized protein YneR [Bacillus sp. UNCCL13]SFQ84797.1 Uncharacterized protein YneR [Bacillus sp. cl95]